MSNGPPLGWGGDPQGMCPGMVCALRSRHCVTKFSALTEQDAKANKCGKNLLVVTLGGTCPFPAMGTPGKSPRPASHWWLQSYGRNLEMKLSTSGTLEAEPEWPYPHGF